MKSYLPIITSLFLLSTSCSSSIAEIDVRQAVTETQKRDRTTQNTTPQINPYIKDNIAPQISVKISSAENGGSGVIIAQQDNTYLVLTNRHVLRSQTEFSINTHDGVTHQATELEKAIDSNDDLALLQFESDKTYQSATINTAAVPQAEQTILAVGYSAETGKLVTKTGKIEQVPDKQLKEGYSIGYTSNIVQGMSGGAMLNTDGELIGINGKSAFPIVDSSYDSEDGTKPSAEEVEQYKKLSWGIGINRLLAQVNPELITAYSLPLPETTDSIETPELTGWLGDLEAKAKQITVRIDSSSGANGSGVIVAKEGNTYTVLTADHVLCEKDNNYKCIDYIYKIVAPDGKEYPVDYNTVKRQEGVDIAIVEFDSKEIYHVAELANYPLRNNDEIFVAGYPQLNKNVQAQWFFSLGLGLAQESGLIGINVNGDKLSGNNSNLANSQSKNTGGYEIVYTSITYGGMSGGAVLDSDGRVIGIHGLAEGETVLNSQSNSLPGKKIQLGLSLGVPIETFVELNDKLEVNAILPIQEKHPLALNSEARRSFLETILYTEISENNATPERWLERGNQLWRLSRFEEAIQAFERALELRPKFAHLAYYGKGLALLDSRKLELAQASLEQATKYNPKFAPAFYLKAYVLQKLNHWHKALAEIDRALLLQPRNANFYNRKGDILSKLQRHSEAEYAYTTAIKIDPRGAFYYNRGILQSERSKLESALADYDRALEINPQDSDIYNNRGNIYYTRGELKLALADYNKALEFDSQNSLAYKNRSGLHRYKGEFELAFADLNRALKINPRYAEAYNNRGLLYSEQGEFELAFADLNRALKINPQLAEAYYNRGNLYNNRREAESALADYNQALQINPKLTEVYLNRGNLYFEQGRLELALADYDKALELSPNMAKVHLNRGLLNARQGETELALDDYNRVLQINPNYTNAYLNRGNLYRELGEAELALTDYNRTLQLDPNLAEAYNNRGLFYFEQGKIELALRDYNQALQINPNQAQAYFNRGLLHKQMGNIAAATSDLQKAKKLYIAQNNMVNAEQATNLLKILDQTPTQTAVNTSQNESVNRSDAQASLDRHENNEVNSAINNYSKAIELDPNNEKALINRGLLYQSLREYELAVEDFTRVIEINPSNPLAYTNRSVVYFIQEKYKLAQSDSERAMKLQHSATKPDSSKSIVPQSSEEYYNRAFEYHQKQEYDLALADYNQAIELNPDREKAYVNRGLVYYNLGKDEEAISDYNRAIEINPNNPNSYQNRGVVYFKREEYELAEADWSKVIELNPNDALAYYNRGLLYKQTGNIAAAISDLQKSQQLYIAQNNTVNAKQVADLLKVLE